MARTPAPKSSKPAVAPRPLPKVARKAPRNPVAETLADIGRGTKALVDQGSAAKQRIVGGFQKLKKFTG